MRVCVCLADSCYSFHGRVTLLSVDTWLISCLTRSCEMMRLHNSSSDSVSTFLLLCSKQNPQSFIIFALFFFFPFFFFCFLLFLCFIFFHKYFWIILFYTFPRIALIKLNTDGLFIKIKKNIKKAALWASLLDA